MHADVCKNVLRTSDIFPDAGKKSNSNLNYN